MKPDVIVTWPKNCDYPLWRQFIRDNRARFNKAIIAFMEPNCGYDFKDFIQSAMQQDNVTFLDAPIPRAGIDDWRDLAVNASLSQSNSDWVWFTEQDFYPRAGFWERVQHLENEDCDAIITYEGVRIHPCCIFIKREAINKTHKKFGIMPDTGDHFCLFTKDIKETGAKIGVIDKKTYRHWQGLSSNWALISRGGVPNYYPDEFIDWLEKSLNVDVPMNGYFMETALAAIVKYGAKKPSKTTPPPHSPTVKRAKFEAKRGDGL